MDKRDQEIHKRFWGSHCCGGQQDRPRVLSTGEWYMLGWLLVTKAYSDCFSVNCAQGIGGSSAHLLWGQAAALHWGLGKICHSRGGGKHWPTNINSKSMPMNLMTAMPYCLTRCLSRALSTVFLCQCSAQMLSQIQVFESLASSILDSRGKGGGEEERGWVLWNWSVHIQNAHLASDWLPATDNHCEHFCRGIGRDPGTKNVYGGKEHITDEDSDGCVSCLQRLFGIQKVCFQQPSKHVIIYWRFSMQNLTLISCKIWPCEFYRKPEDHHHTHKDYRNLCQMRFRLGIWTHICQRVEHQAKFQTGGTECYGRDAACSDSTRLAETSKSHAIGFQRRVLCAGLTRTFIKSIENIMCASHLHFLFTLLELNGLRL